MYVASRGSLKGKEKQNTGAEYVYSADRGE